MIGPRYVDSVPEPKTLANLGKCFRLRDRFWEFNYAGQARNFFRNSVIETVVLRVAGWFVFSFVLMHAVQCFVGDKR